MENYNELCPKFLLNPHINPINNLPIADEEFDYYRDICKYLGYEFPSEKSLQLMYDNEYYGKKVCRDFLEDDTVNPVTGEKIYKGTEDYNNILLLCDHYGFDTSVLGEVKSSKLKTKRKRYLGELPLELEKKLESKAELKKELLPIPKSSTKKELLPIPKSSTKLGLLPIPKGALSSISRKITPVKSEEENILTNLKMIARELHRDEGVKKVVINTLSTILQKNADYDGKSYIITGDKNKYGIKQFILDLLINNEIDLVMKILKFFKLKYIDIAEFLFDFPKYATNESLIINYFINAPPNTDWLELETALEIVYSDWIIEDKLKLMIILLSSAVAVGNDLIIEVLTETFNNWREGIQEEIDEIEDDFDEKDKLIDLVEIIDTLSIR
jgi:hypothetical protein